MIEELLDAWKTTKSVKVILVMFVVVIIARSVAWLILKKDDLDEWKVRRKS